MHTWDGVPFDGSLVAPGVLGSIAAHAHTRPDAPCLTVVSEQHEIEELSARELDVLTSRIAARARLELGAGPGGVLALAPRNDLRSVLAILGLLRAGSALLILNPGDPASRMKEQAALPRAPIVGIDDVTPADLHRPGPADLDAGRAVARTAAIDPAATALIFGTSGSTAASKLVTQSHRNVAVNAHAAGRHHGLRRGDRVLGCLPIHHVNGLHFTLLASLAAGAHAILAHGFDPFGYPRLLERFRPRVASVVPSILEALVDTWRRPPIDHELGYFVSAAAPLSSATVRAAGDRLGVRVLQGYGLTETTNFSTTMPVDVSEGTFRRLARETDIPSIGVAMYGNEVAVLDAQGERARPGDEGEICMRGHNVMTGYVDNPDATGEAFRGGWFHSGDLGTVVRDEDCSHDFFVITGRLKNIAKVRGESVSLDEVDRALRGAPGVLDAACVAVAHPKHGEEILAAVRPGTGARGGLAELLRAHLRAALPPAAIPRRIVRLDRIPRTATGKIRRGELAEILEAHHSSDL